LKEEIGRAYEGVGLDSEEEEDEEDEAEAPFRSPWQSPH